MFGSSFKKIECGDGNPRFILRKVDDLPKAFAMFLPEVAYHFGLSFQGLQSVVEGSGQGEKSTRATKTFEKLDKLHLDIYARFASAYMTYMTDPCNHESRNKLDLVNDKINNSLDKLRGLSTEINRLEERNLGMSNENIIFNNIETYLNDLDLA